MKGNEDNSIARIDVVGHSETQVLPDYTAHALQDNNMQFHIYALHTSSDDDESHTVDEESTKQFSILELPHERLDGKWETLVFEEPKGERTLRAVVRAITDSKNPKRQHSLRDWQNTILFYGPPGSGKSSLSLGLAQKLSIRMSHTFASTKLLHINSHALFSRFYGESPKHVRDVAIQLTPQLQDYAASVLRRDN
jgi:AAA+ superfamily predicted ATPase